jgi:hypothetical protein
MESLKLHEEDMTKTAAVVLVLCLAVPPRAMCATADSTAVDTTTADQTIDESATDNEAPHTWTTELFLGGAASFPTTLSVHQIDKPTIDVDGKYEVRPLDFPIYFSLRIARWQGDRAWAIQVIHHKLYLEDPPPEIQYFNVSHGYNLITIDRLWRKYHAVLGVALGVVFAHPENQVRGLVLPEGGISSYALAGPTGAVSAGYDYTIYRRWFASAEGRLSASYARVAVQDGHANMPDFSAHVHIGLGYRFAESR